MIVIGFDQSLVNTGVAVISGDLSKNTPLTGVIKPKSYGPARILIDIPKSIEKYISMEPDLIVMEGGAFNKAQMQFSLGELSGIIRYMFYKSNVPVLVVPPTQIKKFATSTGKANKFEMMLALHKEFGWNIVVEHEADAVWLAILGWAMLGGDGLIPHQYRVDVVSKVREANEDWLVNHYSKVSSIMGYESEVPCRQPVNA